MLLIISGGLGYTVLNEAWMMGRSRGRREVAEKPRRFSMHGRLVLWMSGSLILGGTLGILVFGLTQDEAGWHAKVLNAAFQSVTARTAGFNSVDIAKLPETSLFILIVLMFIGGSPGSCAGGVKTTTTALWELESKPHCAGKRWRLLGGVCLGTGRSGRSFGLRWQYAGIWQA